MLRKRQRYFWALLARRWGFWLGNVGIRTVQMRRHFANPKPTLCISAMSVSSQFINPFLYRLLFCRLNRLRRRSFYRWQLCHFATLNLFFYLLSVYQPPAVVGYFAHEGGAKCPPLARSCSGVRGCRQDHKRRISGCFH